MQKVYGIMNPHTGALAALNVPEILANNAPIEYVPIDEPAKGLCWQGTESDAQAICRMTDEPVVVVAMIVGVEEMH